MTSVRAGSRPADRVGEVRAVDVRDEVQPRPVAVRAERAGGHGRAEVRAADADVDDVGDRPAGAGDPARAHRLGKAEEAVERGRDVVAGGRLGAAAERHVQHGPALGHVDRLARGHGVAARLDPGGAGERRAGRRARRPSSFSLERSIVRSSSAEAERREAPRVAREKLAQGQRFQPNGLRVHGRPGVFEIHGALRHGAVFPSAFATDVAAEFGGIARLARCPQNQTPTRCVGARGAGAGRRRREDRRDLGHPRPAAPRGRGAAGGC